MPLIKTATVLIRIATVLNRAATVRERTNNKPPPRRSYQSRDREGADESTSRTRAVLIRAATVRERTNGERDQLPIVFLSPAMVRRRCTQRCNVKRTGSVEWPMPSFADRLLTRAALKKTAC